MVLFRRMLWIVLILIVALSLAVLAVVNPFGPSPLNSYQTDGSLQIDGLMQSVRICRDDKGMAYIYAGNIFDLVLAQGYVTAMDRLFQMELTKLYARGRIGELAGQGAKSIDLSMRTLGFYRQAKVHYQLLNDTSRRFLQKYVAGINAFIQECPEQIHLEFKLAGIKPEMWQPEDALTIFYFMGWNSAANIRHELISQMLVEKLGPEKATDLFPINLNPASAEKRSPSVAASKATLRPELAAKLIANLTVGRFEVGSNNWVVDASRSQRGKPILANDPHLDGRMLPGPWYPCALILPDNRAVGVSIPGTPGVAIGRTRYVAFGVTNAYGDAQDLYIESIDNSHPDHYLEGDQSVAFQIIEERLKFRDKRAPDGYTFETIRIRKSRRGPVVSDIFPLIDSDKVMTCRWSAFESMGPTIGFDRFFSCRNAADFRDALRDVNQISLNFVFADMDGNIGWHVTGRMPIRPSGDGQLPHVVKDGVDNWQGWIPFEEMPHVENPEGGWVGTTNHKTTDDNYLYYYSNYFSTPYRQQRLMEIMDSPKATTPENHWQYQRDVINMKARQIAPIMARILTKHPDTENMGKLLAAWDHTDAADRPEPTIFHSLFDELARAVYEDELGADLANAMLANVYFWEERMKQMVEAGHSEWFDDIRTTDKTETLDEILHRAARRVADRLKASLGDDPESWLWGRYHRYHFVSPIARKGAAKGLLGAGPYPASGSGDTLCRAKSSYGDLSDVAIMASLRMVVDLGDPDKMLAVLPGGVTGRQFHPHMTDQIAPFMEGEPLYWWFSDEQIEAHTQHVFNLNPRNS